MLVLGRNWVKQTKRPDAMLRASIQFSIYQLGTIITCMPGNTMMKKNGLTQSTEIFQITPGWKLIFISTRVKILRNKRRDVSFV